MRGESWVVLATICRSTVTGLETEQVCLGAQAQWPLHDSICSQQEGLEDAERLALAHGARSDKAKSSKVNALQIMPGE